MTEIVDSLLPKSSNTIDKFIHLRSYNLRTKIASNRDVVTGPVGQKILKATVLLNTPCPFCGEHHEYRAEVFLHRKCEEKNNGQQTDSTDS